MSDVPDPRRTLVVMLGASVHRDYPEFDNPRFLTSAEELRGYFLDPARFGLPAENLLWLFDSDAAPQDLNNEVQQFLRNAAARPPEVQPRDVIVAFIGHGFHEKERPQRYYLATARYRVNAPDYSYRFQLLQSTVKDEMRFARKYYLLDACYSASAAGEMMEMAGETVASRVLSEAQRQTVEDAADRGTAVLCAAARDEPALAPTADAHTMFTGALLAVLDGSDRDGEVLSLHQLFGAVKGAIRTRFKDRAVMPELHVPDQKHGDVGELPLFPVRRRHAGAPQPSGFFDALHPATFDTESVLHAVVVCRGADDAGDLAPLLQAVSDAVTNTRFRDDIVAAANQCRVEWQAPKVAADAADDAVKVSILDLDRAFGSAAAMQQAVAALCKADIAVFDLTGWEAGATFLLGVRAVVRRGVSIASVGGDFTIGSALDIPFNLQLLNLVAHSTAQEERGRGKPFELIGDKIVNGFRELANLPHYLDLPAYDSVRQIGVESGAYRPVRSSERILALCPFGAEYTRRNFDRLDKVLPSCVQQQLHKSGDRSAPQPALVRLLDLRTPRLIAQTLFESIRLTDMCVVDWTLARPNVIFEAGVRMAINPLGAVHIVEQGSAAAQAPRSASLRSLLRRFEPIEYRIGTDRGAFDRMVQRFEASVEESTRRKTNAVYAAVAAAIDRRSQPAALPLVSELTRSANLLDPDDQEGTGISPVLYHDVNGDLAREAAAAAADRRLAAWLFMSRRYTPGEIVAAPELLDAFELLSFQVKRWARRAGRSALVSEVAAALALVREALPVADSAPAEPDLTRVVARAKSRKEEAKDLREEKNVAAAVQLLERAVALLTDAAVAVRLDDAVAPGKPMRDLATQLADCLGMLGGNYRRLGALERARDCFERGRRYEESPLLMVMSSYNAVNAIVTAILSQAGDPDTQRGKLQSAVAVISRQVRGERRSDQWAWADLALCHLLLGDRDAALRSYARMRDLGGDGAMRSIVPVLDELRPAAASRAADIAAALEALSGGAAAPAVAAP
jgi:tetratricopeptide (TPR) repeat protein